jgi:hypothetical protein
MSISVNFGSIPNQSDFKASVTYRVFEAVINCFTKVTFHDCFLKLKLFSFSVSVLQLIILVQNRSWTNNLKKQEI